MPDEENREEDIGEELPEEESIGLKGPEAAAQGQDWEKVEAIVNSAKSAIDAGTPFPDVLATLIETLTALQSETTQTLGGLGVGGPEMNLPEDNEDVLPPEEEAE